MALPSDEMLAQIDAALAKANITAPGARAEMIRAYDDNKFVSDLLNSYVVLVADDLAKANYTNNTNANGDTTNGGERADDAAFAAKTGVTPSTNPWSPNYKGKDAEAKRIRLIRTLGTKAAQGMAFAAGTDIAGRPLRNAAS